MAQLATARGVVHAPTVVIGFTAPRPWRQKLQDLVDALVPIEHSYATNKGLSSEAVRRDIENFFRYCRELADWLWQNTGVNEQTVMQFVRNSHYLRLADAMAQTTKHHTRAGKNPITAQIEEMSGNPDGFRARIDWSRPSGSSGSRDALELARGCVRSWKRFVRTQKL
jgi:hypothetical protein